LAVQADINELMNGKTIGELVEIQREIESVIEGADAGVDVQFYEAVIAKVPLYKARAVVTTMHNEVVRTVATMDPKEPQKRTGPLGPSWEEILEEQEKANPPSEKEEDEDGDDASELGLSPELEEYGDCSPPLLSEDRFKNVAIVDAEEENKERKDMRIALLGEYADQDAADEEFKKEAQKANAADEANFGKEDVVDVARKTYGWEDKYRPRKPRFFNRVKCGFEWNKYNQTHYDYQTPPPKFVQGYKFNIFYPDLIDKSKPPKYFLEKSDQEGTVTLRFTAGPPYEDVAFKILNKEWNLMARHGFRSSFERGVLQLYVNFKRWRYRR